MSWAVFLSGWCRFSPGCVEDVCFRVAKRPIPFTERFGEVPASADVPLPAAVIRRGVHVEYELHGLTVAAVVNGFAWVAVAVDAGSVEPSHDLPKLRCVDCSCVAVRVHLLFFQSRTLRQIPNLLMLLMVSHSRSVYGCTSVASDAIQAR